MENKEELEKVLGTLDGLLQQTNLEDVTSESAGFEELPDGYYLCEVEKANLTTSKSSGQPMVAFQFKVNDDGYNAELNGEEVNITRIAKTKNRKVFIYYTLKDETSVKRFVTDMLKFEGENVGESLLGKEYFTNSQLLEDALDVLIGMKIYIKINTNEKDDGSTSTWRNLISWKRAAALELPV